MAYDPIGPGTPAWNNFDRAIIAWRRCGSKPPFGQRRAWRLSVHMKSYYNHRQEMVKHLKKHGGRVDEWIRSLVFERDNPDYLTDGLE